MLGNKDENIESKEKNDTVEIEWKYKFSLH